MKDFFHVHINKTGGMSIRHLLNMRKDHNTTYDIVDAHGLDEWRRRYTFTMIRNPWDRMASLYKYRLRTNMHYIKTDDISFPEFIKKALIYKQKPYYNTPAMLGPQANWLAHPIDFIGVFEEYETSVRIILDRIEYPNPPEEIPHVNASPGPHYKEMYLPWTRGVVERHFRRDILKWGYRFDEHPSIDEVNNW